MLSCYFCVTFVLFFFFKQKTAYEMRISDWSSDVCSSDLPRTQAQPHVPAGRPPQPVGRGGLPGGVRDRPQPRPHARGRGRGERSAAAVPVARSEEHTSELPSLMRNSYAVFCLKKKMKRHCSVAQPHTQYKVHQVHPYRVAKS